MPLLTRPTLALVGLAAIVLAGSSAIAADPTAAPSMTPLASASAAAPALVGPITWKRNTKGKDFGGAGVTDSVHFAGTTSILVGFVSDDRGQPIAAAWSSSNGTKWGRVKWQTPDSFRLRPR